MRTDNAARHDQGTHAPWRPASDSAPHRLPLGKTRPQPAASGAWLSRTRLRPTASGAANAVCTCDAGRRASALVRQHQHRTPRLKSPRQGSQLHGTCTPVKRKRSGVQGSGRCRLPERGPGSAPRSPEASGAGAASASGPPPSSNAPSLCPATVPPTPSASLNGIGNRQ